MTDLRKAIGAILKRLQFVALVVFVFAFSPMVHAQTDTLQYSEEIQQDSMVQYLTPLEYAFMMHEETSWMVKGNLIFVNMPSQTFKIKMSFENRIFPGFSLNTTLQYLSEEQQSDFSYINNVFSLSLEPRWYYTMKKKVREGKSKLNLSGNYLSIGAGYSLTQSDSIDFLFNKEHDNDFVAISAKWGSQRRFLKLGYIDFGLRANLFFYPYKDLPSSFRVSTFLDAGLAFAKDKQKFNPEGLCSVLRCYASDRFLFKTNLINLLSVGVFNDEFSFNFNPQFAAEIKLGQSPFSINTELRIQSGSKTFAQASFDYFFLGNLLIEGRWYYNLRKRMLKGKTGNGLSANYVALGNSYRFIHFNYNDNNIDSKPNFGVVGFQIVTGIQRTYSEHFYFDINLGIQFRKVFSSYGTFLFDFAGLMAIGYRF